MILVWEGKAFVRAVTGMLLVAVFDGFALGMSLVQNRFLFGFSDPAALDDLKWESWPLAFRLTQIGLLALAIGAFILMLSGVLRFRLIGLIRAEPLNELVTTAVPYKSHPASGRT